MPETIIITDLDGTLLHPTTYSFEEAKPALQLIRARGVPVLEADGEVREYIGTCIDITDQRKVESELRESRATLVAAQVAGWAPIS